MIGAFMNRGMALAACGNYPLQVIIFELMANDALSVDVIGDVVRLQEELRSTTMIPAPESIAHQYPPADLSVIIIIEGFDIIASPTPPVLQPRHQRSGCR